MSFTADLDPEVDAYWAAIVAHPMLGARRGHAPQTPYSPSEKIVSVRVRTR